MGSIVEGYSSELRTLCDLGLTFQQAKAYLALSKIGQTSMKELSEAADIDRGECYRIVSQLLEKGLISKVFTSPIKFEVISFNNAIKNLLEKRKNEVSALEQNTEMLLKKLRVEKKQSVTQEMEEVMRFVPMTPAAYEDGKQRFVRIEKSVDILTGVYRCESVDGAFYNEEKKALKKGVKFRMLLSDPEKTFRLERLPAVQKLLKKPSFSLRIIFEEIAAPLAIQDSKQVEIYISKETHITKSSPLITNNERMVRLVQYYFDSLWKQGREICAEM